MIRFNKVIGLCCGGMLAVALNVGAQPAQKIPRIGWLGMDTAMQAPRFDAFKQGLREQGYVEGKNIVIEFRSADGRFDRLPALAAELATLNVDVIVTAAPPAVRAAQQATKTIPIVMTVHDPIGMGFVASLAHPGGNITGVAFQDSDLSTKRLDLLRQVVPNLKRVAILWNREGSGDAAVQAVESAARDKELQVRVLEVKGPGDFAAAITEAKAWGAQGLVQLASPLITKNRRILLDQLSANHLPVTCEMREYVVDGCLMTYSADINLTFRSLAYFVVRILKGAKPADLAIDQPRKFEFVINETTVRNLGLIIPNSVRVQATEVVK
jgi:putative tryptophan/tyrosine transport system substrate-binding protein